MGKDKTIEVPHVDETLDITTAEAFREKYLHKRFNSSNAPKAIMYQFLYECYLLDEGKEVAALYPDISKIQAKVKTYEDAEAWTGYLNLIEWQRSAFNTAVFMRNSLLLSMQSMDNLIRTLVAGENLRNEVTGEQTEVFNIWLEHLTIEACKAQEGGAYSLNLLRKNIEAGIRYMTAYNTFMSLIAKALDTPEYKNMQVTMGNVWHILAKLNTGLDGLRATITRCRAEGVAGWTPETFQETIAAFRPIGDRVPPVPKDRIEYALDGIKAGVKKYAYSWHGLYFHYSTKYWRTDVYGGK